MAKAFVIDVALCSGCYSCQMACKDEHCGNDWSPVAKPQPDTGQFWIKVDEKTVGSIPKVRVEYLPHLCGHCASPLCAGACPGGAVTTREDGFVLIDPEACTGCGACMDACPYGAIFNNDALGICQKCTGCVHLLDNGYPEPRCSEVCPTGALTFGEESDLAELIKGADVLVPASGASPRVYYRNLPGKFIAGTVYDPQAKEIVEHAKALAVSGGKIRSVLTDDFGDFWFDDLPVGSYDITITADGYAPKYFYGVRTDDCVNLGDIPLDRNGGA
ncbi:MAG: 4Fe-4S binding protein [Clostridiales Family XIII bacterium]|jgi:Fe-S-cluster-containing dehydrogenase component|nr:4Fe-4S binding protein [Clostridiales Family XIII bacterium]